MVAVRVLPVVVVAVNREVVGARVEDNGFFSEFVAVEVVRLPIGLVEGGAFVRALVLGALEVVATRLVVVAVEVAVRRTVAALGFGGVVVLVLNVEVFAATPAVGLEVAVDTVVLEPAIGAVGLEVATDAVGLDVGLDVIVVFANGFGGDFTDILEVGVVFGFGSDLTIGFDVFKVLTLLAKVFVFFTTSLTCFFGSTFPAITKTSFDVICGLGFSVCESNVCPPTDSIVN